MDIPNYRNVQEALDAVVEVRGAPRTWEQSLEHVVAACQLIMVGRHHKYGPGNINRHGLNGIAVRAGDKLERLDNQLEHGGDAIDESIEDTLGDFANYGIIGIMYRRGWWNLPAEVLGQVRSPAAVIRSTPVCQLAPPATESGLECGGDIAVCPGCGGEFCAVHLPTDIHECEENA